MIEHAAAQGSAGWFAARLGIPSASQASSLVTPRTLAPSKSLYGYAARLALERYRGAPSDTTGTSRAMLRGQRWEAQARAAYAWLADVEVRRAGFCTDERGRFGASPDGLVGERGGIETKCPEDAEFVRALMHVETHGEAPPEYLPQVHMQLLVTDRAWWDLVFWHPDLPDEPVIARVVRDRVWDRRLLVAIARCRRHRDRVLATLEARARRFGVPIAFADERDETDASDNGEREAARVA